MHELVGAGAPRVTAGLGARLGWRRALWWGFLLCVVMVFAVTALLNATTLGYGFDFRYQYYEGATAVVEGEPLYASPDDPAYEKSRAYAYPPLTAVLLAPVSFVPRLPATVLMVLASLVAVVAAVALVGVRDPVCYLAIVASSAFWNVLETANVTAFLALGIAVLWRYRASVWPVAITVGLAVATKLFLWPLLIWAVATRRLRATLVACAVALGATVLSWAAVGFHGLTTYPRVAEALYDLHARRSYSFVGMSTELGLGQTVGTLCGLVVGGGLLGACVYFGRRDDDLRALACAVVAAMAFTPIVWQHYVVLLLPLLAVARPRFSGAWVLPVLLWLSPRDGNGEGLEPLVPAFVVLVWLLVILATPPVRRLAEARA